MKYIAISSILLLGILVASSQRFSHMEIRKAGSTVVTMTNAILSDGGLATNITIYGDLNSVHGQILFWTTFIATNADLYGEITTSLTPYRVIVTDEDGILSVSAITSTELTYLDNARLNIQVQLDAITNGSYLTNVIIDKSTLSNVTFEGNINISAGANVGVYIDNAGNVQPALPVIITNYPVTTIIQVGFTNSPFNIFEIQVTNNFTLSATNYFKAAVSAIRLVPVNYVSNYTVTLDSTFQRFGANFSSADITVTSNKNVIVSLTSWGTSGAGVAAAYRTQQ